MRSPLGARGLEGFGRRLGAAPVALSAAEDFLANRFGQEANCIAAYLGRTSTDSILDEDAIPDFSPTGVDAVAEGAQSLTTAYVSSPADPPDLQSFNNLLRTRFIERPNTGAFSFGTTGSFTVMTWFRSTPSGSLQFICSTSDSNNGFFWAVNGTGMLFRVRSGGANSDAAPAGVFTSGVWTHAAIVRDTSGTRQKVYTNGVQRVNQAVTARNATEAIPLCIGQNPTSLNGPLFGAFEEELALFSVYDTNVSAAAIDAQYQAQRGLFGV